MTLLDRPRAVSGTTREAAGDNPFAVHVRGANQSGFCSIQDYPDGIGDLSYTHQDAGGFYNYLAKFNAPNFWYRDGGVLAWIYGEDYDDWQNTYGFDACIAEYHSGHGGMGADGVFYMPMGGTWNNASWVYSSGMRLGNEVARYLFFSTCQSLRVNDGQSPVKTWGQANLGVRMIFGFESTSVDSPSYGANFWTEWNKNKSFGQAWLDASWDIDHHQAPSVAGCGTTLAEAQNRVGTERLLYAPAVSTAYWAWSWYNAATALAEPSLALPAVSRRVVLGPQPRNLGDLADHFGVQMGGERLDGGAVSGRPVVLGADRGGPTLSVDGQGRVEVTLAEPDRDGEAPEAEEALRIARQAVGTFGLADTVDLLPATVRYGWAGGHGPDGPLPARRQETHVVFDQVVDGEPLITPGLGEVRVSVGPSGTVTRIVDASRPVADIQDRNGASGPPEPGGASGVGTRSSASSAEDLLAAPRQRLLRRLAASGHAPTEVTAVPGSTAVGLAVEPGGDMARQAVRQTVEVDCGHGLRKRFVLEA